MNTTGTRKVEEKPPLNQKSRNQKVKSNTSTPGLQTKESGTQPTHQKENQNFLRRVEDATEIVHTLNRALTIGKCGGQGSGNYNKILDIPLSDNTCYFVEIIAKEMSNSGEEGQNEVE